LAHDAATIKQIETCVATGGEHGVLCADGHKGFLTDRQRGRLQKQNFTERRRFRHRLRQSRRPHGRQTRQIAPKIDKILTMVREISFGIGPQQNTRRADCSTTRRASETDRRFEIDALSSSAGGRWNHYVDIFADEQDRVWVGVHFGSRGLGHKTATYFLRAAGGKDGMDVPPTVVDEKSEIGHDYLAGMHLAGRYAYAGREAVARHVVKNILGAQIVEEVHNHHNFAWREKHNGEEFWVVRKGATPAFPGQKGFVGGSMGDNAVIIEGVDSPTSREALFSTVHGAGRIMSRTAAKENSSRSATNAFAGRTRPTR
jgi:tRNA-splicing ligase RtcB